MAVLSDRDIVAAREAGRLRIDPFDPKNVTPNGYDLTIAEVAVLTTPPKTVTTGSASVPAHARFAVSTAEVVELGPDIAAQLWLRTTWARQGVIAVFGKVDAGFRGTLTLPAMNANDSPLQLPVGERYAQIVFETLLNPAEKVYAQRSGQYQDQRGVRLR